MSYPNYKSSSSSSYIPKQRTLSEVDYQEFKRRKLYREALLKRRREQGIRRLIFVSIIFAAFVFSFINISYKHVYLPFKNRDLVLEPAANFLNSTEATLTTSDLLGNKSLLNNNTVNIQPDMSPIPLRNELTGLKEQLLPILTSDDQYKAGFFVWDSATNDYVTINSDETFKTASMIKVPVLIELFRQIEAGQIKYDSMLKFDSHHLAEGSGSLQYKPIGGDYSIDYLADIMIKESDNTATNMLLNEIGGMATLNSTLKSWGIQKGHMENWLPDLTGTNVMSPKEYATMLYNVVANNNFLTRDSRLRIINYMSNIKHRNLVNFGMPEGAKIAHKTGDIGEMVGDAAVVTLPNGKNVIIVAMVERPWNSYKAKDMIREASRVTYNYLTSQTQTTDTATTQSNQ